MQNQILGGLTLRPVEEKHQRHIDKRKHHFEGVRRFTRKRQIQVKQGKRDPLDADIWDSWQNEEEDWETEKFTEDELIDILFDVSMFKPLLHATPDPT